MKLDNDMPTDGKLMHKMLLALDGKSSFVVNGKYECRFDFAQYGNRKAPLFTKFEKDENCPRLCSEADVLVYDRKNGKNLIGKVVLSIDSDLTGYSANAKPAGPHSTIYVKPVGEASWSSMEHIIYLADIKQNTI